MTQIYVFETAGTLPKGYSKGKTYIKYDATLNTSSGYCPGLLHYCKSKECKLRIDRVPLDSAIANMVLVETLII